MTIALAVLLIALAVAGVMVVGFTISLIVLAVVAVIAFIVSGFWVMAWFAVLDLMESIRKGGW